MFSPLILRFQPAIFLAPNADFHIRYIDPPSVHLRAATGTGLGAIDLCFLSAWQQALPVVVQIMGLPVMERTSRELHVPTVSLSTLPTSLASKEKRPEMSRYAGSGPAWKGGNGARSRFVTNEPYAYVFVMAAGRSPSGACTIDYKPPSDQSAELEFGIRKSSTAHPVTVPYNTEQYT